MIELLLVIVIIGMLAFNILISLSTAVQKAKINKARLQLKQIKQAVMQLQDDTGNWPLGCPPTGVLNPEQYIDNDAFGGIVKAPTVGVFQAPCEWTASEVAVWKGPYIGVLDLRDPWGTSYFFDTDYNCALDDDGKNPSGCGNHTDWVVAIVSYGPNKQLQDPVEWWEYDSDNIIEIIYPD